MPIINITDTTNYDSLFQEDSGPVVIRYTAKWCGPCKKIAEPYKNLSTEFEDIKFVCIDVDEFKDLPDQVSSLPTFIFLNNGIELERYSQSNITSIKKTIQECF